MPLWKWEEVQEMSWGHGRTVGRDPQRITRRLPSRRLRRLALRDARSLGLAGVGNRKDVKRHAPKGSAFTST